MKKNGYILEMRFLVPLHLVGLARRAMAPFAVGELTPVVTGPRGKGKRRASSEKCQLTDQELELLLRG
ncbi:hypothetical protein [Fundidesulfovibrio terrae]|uniref:hypothetical protein n=1 Tax=Fundidesulfovibrio terrae TaxID=2922866 RepID=UPI001FAE9DAE|nr:hypothetical protein [Fundidesulfovibrio terrae]